mgnify:FL=1
MKFVDPSEAIKRLAAAQGIDVLNLVRTPEQLAQMKQQMTADRTNASLVDQVGQLAGTPLVDPSKNPQIAEQAGAVIEGLNAAQSGQQPPQQ